VSTEDMVHPHPCVRSVTRSHSYVCVCAGLAAVHGAASGQDLP
jgi:hypothetical protein